MTASLSLAEVRNGTGWPRNVRFVVVTEDQRQSLTKAVVKTQEDAYKDSNDYEISHLRDALDLALSMLGVAVPDLPQERVAALMSEY